MALRLDYLARETGQNLVRNWLLTVATVLIVAVTLTLFGVTFLMTIYGMGNAFAKWNDDVSFIVYMNPDASTDQIDLVSKTLDESPQVDSVDYYDADESWALFKRIFEKDNPAIIDTMTKEDLPTSFRVKPSNPDANVVRELANTFDPKPGVFEVEFPDDQVRQFQAAMNKLRLWALTGVGILLVSSVILIFIAIQTAVFSRRREIEVMRLVGATNWFIRVPFLFEGLIQGVMGALIACGFLKAVDVLWSNTTADFAGSLFGKLTWTSSEFGLVVLGVMAIGAVVGAIGSLTSVTWYLRG